MVIKLKAIEALAPVHEAQILTHMKFANKTIGLLINFNVTLLKNGIDTNSVALRVYSVKLSVTRIITQRATKKSLRFTEKVQHLININYK